MKSKKLEDTKPSPAVAAQPAPALSSQAPAKAAPRTVAPEIKYQYYQSGTSVNISVLVKNLTPEDVSVDFQTNHLKVVVRVEGFEGLCV